jgi:predicted CoA-binding protein
MDTSDPAVIERVVRGARTVAVVGASPNPERPSHGVARYLLDAGLTVYPVNPGIRTLFDRPAYASVADIPEHVDVVDVFRRPEAVPAVARDAVAAGAGALWLQLGVINEDAVELAAAGGLAVVMDRCLRVEHRRLFGR